MKTLKKTLAIILTVIMVLASVPMTVSFAADCSVDGHDYGEWFVSLEPTCTKEGIESRICSVCKKNESRFTAMLEHSYSSDVKAPTCIETGYTTYICTDCGHTYKGDVKDALGHSFGEWTTVKAPTCKEKGEEIRECSVCNRTETAETEITDHNYVYTEEDPTCLTEGYIGYKCTYCSDYYIVEKIDALGHSFGEWTTEKEPTCKEEGVKSRVCSVCQDVETHTIITLDHTYKVETVAPTCTVDGYNKYTCTACGTVVVIKNTAAGHSFSIWKVVKAASCTELGEEEKKCASCGTTETRSIPKTSHPYTVEVTEPTCTAVGKTVYTCQECSYSTTVSVAATGHKLSGWIEIIVPTCTTKGMDERKCLVCGEERETREVPVALHPYVAEYTPATCTTDGYTTYTCSVCSDSYKVEASGAKGHSDGDNDGVCDVCETSVPKDPSAGCGCMCHKGGFMGFIYKIVSIFWKLFKTNQECECGISHY